jgi:uncharacterized protein (DUF2235 family)
MAVSYGFSNDIRDAYTYLINNFRDDDQLFLFGFSRGAYTARAVCSLLKMYGLIRPGNDPLVPYAVRMMMGIGTIQAKIQPNHPPTKEQQQQIDGYFGLAEDFKATMSRTTCMPHFVGVWDTVSSVGWKDNPLKLPFATDNPDIGIGRHAIAIDEKRAFFRTNRWMPSKLLSVHGPRNHKEVWFAGVHSDVGGGYPEKDSGLSKFPLQWMLQEAKAAGLHVNPQREDEVLGNIPGKGYALADPDAMMHESLEGWWKLAELIPKPHFDFKSGTTEMRANRGRRRTIPNGAFVHESVYRRKGGAYAAEVLPPNTVSTH